MKNKVKEMLKIFCFIGIHDWLIHKWSRYKDLKCRFIYEEGFDRQCQRCDKKQRLERPKEYHPSKYVWTDITKDE